jgi:hypothetical protein
MKPELQKMADPINLKDCIFAHKKVSHFGRYRKLKYGELYMDHPNQRKKSEIPTILPRRSEMGD